MNTNRTFVGVDTKTFVYRCTLDEIDENRKIIGIKSLFEIRKKRIFVCSHAHNVEKKGENDYLICREKNIVHR